MTPAQCLHRPGRPIRHCLLALGLALSPLPAAQDEPTSATETATETAAEASPSEETTENAAPEPPRYASRRERDRELLAERFPGEAQWLTIPPPESRALALYRPAIAEPKGALLMFYSADNPPHWPPPLANLRQALPRHGWATFGVTLPVPEPPPVPERPAPEPSAPVSKPSAPNSEPSARASEPSASEKKDNEEPADDTTETDDGEPTESEEATEAQAEPDAAAEPEPDPLPPRPERIAYHVNAANQWLANNGQGNLVVMLDPLSAPAVMDVLQPQVRAGTQGPPPTSGESPLTGPIRALILINRPGAVELTDEQLTRIFAVPELPVLDVFIGPTARLQKRQRHHRDIARRQRMAHYQSLALGAPDVHDPDNERGFWVRRIQAFMQRQAEGVEVRLSPPP